MSEAESTLGNVPIAAKQGAIVWWAYGLLEAAFSVCVPHLKLGLSRVFPGLGPTHEPPFVSATLTAFLLLAYPAIGAALGALLARLARRVQSRRHPATALAMGWSAVGILTLLAVFVLNALLASEAPVLLAVVIPAGLASLRLALACQRGSQPAWRWLTHPVVVLLILVGTAFIVQPRRGVGLVVSSAVGLGCGATALLATLGGFCISTRVRWARKPRGGWAPGWIAAILLSLASVAATIPQSRGARPLERPVASPRPADRRPNVILITWDTVRADHLSLLGYQRDTTPFLREFARTDATVYRNAITTGNWTLPSHASIFTGQVPRRHGAHHSSTYPGILPISKKSDTMAEVLASGGYRTAGIVANSVVLTPHFGFDRGFSYFDSTPLPSQRSQEGRRYLLRGSVHVLLTRRIADRREEPRFAPAHLINERARRFLESAAGKGQPFFLFLNYMDAHRPYLPPSPFAERYPGKEPNFDWAGSPRFVNETGCQLDRPLQPRELQHLTSQYDGAIAYLDENLRQLLETIKRLGLYDDSLIILTSDHGEAFGENDLLFHGLSVYQHQVHVPLVVKFPSSRSGSTVDSAVSVIDLLPTVLDVLGLDVPKDLAGQSLRHIQSDDTRWLYSESDKGSLAGRSVVDAQPFEIAVFLGGIKRISRRGGGEELYNLFVDPFESENLYSGQALPLEWATALSQYLANEPTSPAGRPVTDPEVIQNLRSLGYLQ